MSDTENVAAGEPEAKRMKKSPPANGKYGDAGNPGNDDSNDSTASNASTNDTAAVDSEDSNQGKTEAQKKVCVAGSDIAGAVLICGQMNWDMTGRSSAPKGQKLGGGRCVYNPSRLTHLKGVKVRSIISGCTSAHNLIITTEGKLMTFGRNDKGQLGHGDTTRRDVPTVVEELKDFNVVGGACGKNHTLVVTDRGTVFGFGDNKMGQCGAGANHQVVTVPTKLSKMKPIAIVACGAEFSMIADVDGSLYSFGLPEYGQLGHNTDGKFFITSSKLSFHVEHTPRRVGVFIKKSRDGTVPVDNVEIKDLACGANHTVALDSRGRIFTWGFGGYGRLGHNEPKDEMVPRLLEFFDGPNRGAKMVAAGSSYSLAVSSLGGTLLMWGQAKRTGEANMYPKPVQDLQGWNVRVLACSHTSMGVIAEDSVITWGPSPCYGELGLGMAVKSSSKPKEVSDLDEVKVLDMAMGMAHSLFIVADETDSDKTALDALPEYDPEEEATS